MRQIQEEITRLARAHNPREEEIACAFQTLEDVRVHDLKHTFDRRLRAVGVSFEDQQI